MPNTHMKDCIEACLACREICERTLYQHCMKMGNGHTEPDHVRLMADCIAICDTAAGFMIRGSDLHAAVCAACAEICEACAVSCGALDGRPMQECVQACRACAESCRSMGAGFLGQGKTPGRGAQAFM